MHTVQWINTHPSNHHLITVQNIFSTPGSSLCLFQSIPPSKDTPLFWLLSLYISLAHSWTSYKWNVIYNTFCILSWIWHILVIVVLRCIHMFRWNNNSFHCCLVSCYLALSLSILLTDIWAVYWSGLLSRVTFSYMSLVHNSVGYVYLEMELLGQRVGICLIAYSSYQEVRQVSSWPGNILRYNNWSKI